MRQIDYALARRRSMGFMASLHAKLDPLDFCVFFTRLKELTTQSHWRI